MTRTIVVIGGGITGAFAAYFLAGRGCQVVVIDAGDDHRRASSNNPGGINPLHGPGIPGLMSDFALQCYLTHRAEWTDITRLSQIEFNGRIITRIFAAFSDEEATELSEAAYLYEGNDGFSARWLDATALRKRDPRISDEAFGGLWTTGNGAVNPVRYRNAVIKAACAKGARSASGRVREVAVRNGRAHELRTEAQSIECDEIVLATGPWCEWIYDNFDVVLPVRPVRGDLLLAELGIDVPVHDVTWNQYGVYHHDAGQFWLGGTWEEAGFDDSPRPGARQDILNGVSRIIPEAGRSHIVHHAVGLRPVTPDGMPVVGRMPGVENAWLALGGGSKGMLLSSGMGKAVADMVTGSSVGAHFSFLSPDRFTLPVRMGTTHRQRTPGGG